MSDRQVWHFPGEEIDVYWDERLCTGIGECVRAEGVLFMNGRDPWCKPDMASKGEVREVVERCPSGALFYRDKVGTPEAPPTENTVRVALDGPLHFSGDLAIAGAPHDRPGLRYRAALCRCGLSKNPPLCDNSHQAKFVSYGGAKSDSGPGLRASGGKLVVKAIPGGPLKVQGNLTVRAANGRIIWQGTETSLCRCGASNNKPFCDGSHRRVGFEG